MITAQTVQLLDANNKNISPAVNIESIYFEGTKEPTSPDTYRFSLRDKFVVMGGNLKQYEAESSGSSHLYIPYIYASRAFNSSSGVWQIDSDRYDMAPAAKEFIDAVCINKYATIQNVSANFLDLQGTNYMKGSIKMTNGVIYDADGIETTNGKAYVHLDETGKTVNVYGETAIKMSGNSGNSVVEANQTESYLSFSGSNSKITANTNGVVITSNKDVSVTASKKFEVKAADDIKISSNSDIELKTASGEVNIDATEIKLYGKKFPTPTNPGESKKLLSLTTDEQMDWMTLGRLDIYNFGSQSSTKKISYIEDSSIIASRVSFVGESDSYPVLGDAATTIKIKSLTSGSEVVSLDAKETTTVNFARINNKSILTSDDIKLPTHDDVDTSINNKIKVSQNAASNIATVNITSNKFEFTQSNVTIKEDIVYARAFSMNSDRRLKTDIREDCFEREMPAIHGFKWKDTSIQGYGFIAQELEDSGFQEMVHESTDGTKTVDYMTALSYKVARLEQENKKLWKEIEELKSKLK